MTPAQTGALLGAELRNLKAAREHQEWHANKNDPKKAKGKGLGLAALMARKLK